MKEEFDEMLPWHQATLIAYNQIRENEELKLLLDTRSINVG